MKLFLGCLMSVVMSWSFALDARANFQCEVLALEGNTQIFSSSGTVASAKEGDLLSEGDTVEVPEGGWLDVAFDGEWKNVTRLEGGAKVKISAISPAKLELHEGALYAKLKKLPQDTSFEVRTPTAVAAVRGTEYRTVLTDGKTEVFNFSPSRVYVYGVDAAGQTQAVPIVIEQEQKTRVESAGAAPEAPQPMAAEEKQVCEAAQKAIEQKVAEVVAEGRAGKIQTVADIEKQLSSKSQAKYDEESRVTDTRRRTFK